MAEAVGMEKRIGVRVLALCGESVLIKGIEAILQDREGVEIVLPDASRPGEVCAVDTPSPDIVVFDLTPSQLSWVFAFLRTHTDVILIGLDVDRDLALFLSSEWRELPTVANLIQIIEGRIQIRSDRRLS
jgi:hypothetical protein